MKNDQRTLLHLIQVIRAHLLLAFIMMGGTAFAQDYIVKGKVSSAEDEMGIPGVNIILKGTSTGTVTDSNGNYAMQLPDGSGTLIFSFIGYQPEEVPVNGQSVINVSLLPSVEQLSEIVVTALGIERESQSLGYAVQEVDGESLNEARETNFTNALAGKVAGLDVKSNTGVGSSTRVVLRGESSLSINGNQPLFVVDGIPISNDINNTTSADYGNGASEINPADIERDRS
jgi:hypothetical protein